ncbi:alpha/beta fold hydrolase [Streptomyces sp. JH34]|uniref:alpha/beta hydrolase n=1 Tax=Streptomyces sp. JH34 TaxID=2793633 RepID=UPI0023F65893|nr:alpha/beta fold hydrolase [Streptomyces sp. JH34]MDF6017859.1 alpha/beta hydrolase [Streptomyces sp. JH34]
MTEYTDHHAPEGLRTRGTVVVVPGRGETRATYSRLGRRLAADAYRVRVVDALGLDERDLEGSLTRFGEQLAAAAEDSATGENGVVRPLVLVGADTGAVAVAALLGRGGVPSALRPDAVVLAGIPGGGAAAGGGWEDELDVRTSCPAHRDTLTEDTGTRRGALDQAVPEALLTAAHDGGIDIPALLLVGDADPLADRDALAATAKSLPRARLAVVRDAHHDVLNDMQHRSVAAETVTFLETLRNGLVPVVTVDSSAW